MTQAPTAEPFLFTRDGALLCPHCQFNCVHLDDVYVAGRPQEDGEVHPVHVDAAGRTSIDSSVSLPIPDVGRRHVFALKGWCEGCGGHFSIEFGQHKGQTMAAIREPLWETLTPKPQSTDEVGEIDSFVAEGWLSVPGVSGRPTSPSGVFH